MVDGGSKPSMSSSSTVSKPLLAHMPIRSASMGLSASSCRRSTLLLPNEAETLHLAAARTLAARTLDAAAPSLPAATQLAQQATITPTAPAPRA